MSEYELSRLIDTAFRVYEFILIARVLMSWVPDMERTSLGQFLYKITEPYLKYFRRFIPPLGPIDISPIVAIFTLILIQAGLETVLRSIL
ncbi:YggT family protein [Effusibacillus lacus]|uniref:YggT family protein n=1 Tax=Effusibacillus lacus TaxID=1348429 RepID=A0A292YR83_9BACL|nr:YggT family protein [Effusibacillus lacus]TCS75669.1 YggT family protein [Effusibacillus lacus]GAX90990.1 YggT family protein [Effusibacillus lacus]